MLLLCLYFALHNFGRGMAIFFFFSFLFFFHHAPYFERPSFSSLFFIHSHAFPSFYLQRFFFRRRKYNYCRRFFLFWWIMTGIYGNEKKMLTSGIEA